MDVSVCTESLVLLLLMLHCGYCVFCGKCVGWMEIKDKANEENAECGHIFFFMFSQQVLFCLIMTCLFADGSNFLSPELGNTFLCDIFCDSTIAQ